MIIRMFAPPSAPHPRIPRLQTCAGDRRRRPPQLIRGMSCRRMNMTIRPGIVVASLLLALCCWHRPSAEESQTPLPIVDGFHQGARFQDLGHGFANMFSVASEVQARAKVDNLRTAKSSVTVQEFLGGRIRFIRVTYFAESFGDFEKARAFLRTPAYTRDRGRPEPGARAHPTSRRSSSARARPSAGRPRAPSPARPWRTCPRG